MNLPGSHRSQYRVMELHSQLNDYIDDADMRYRRVLPDIAEELGGLGRRDQIEAHLRKTDVYYSVVPAVEGLMNDFPGILSYINSRADEASPRYDTPAQASTKRASLVASVGALLHRF